MQWEIVAASQAAGPPVRLSGVLLGIGVAVVVACAGVVRRAFRASDKLAEKYGPRRTAARDEIVASRVRPRIAEVVTQVHPLVEWPRRGHVDVSPDVDGVLERQQFARGLALIAQGAGDADQFRRCQERMVAAAKRQGLTMVPFLPAWAYLVFWVSETGMALPKSLTAGAALAVAAAGGWFLSEALSEARDANAFAKLESTYAEPDTTT